VLGVKTPVPKAVDHWEPVCRSICQSIMVVSLVFSAFDLRVFLARKSVCSSRERPGSLIGTAGTNSLFNWLFGSCTKSS
jgi:hypothetical protein